MSKELSASIIEIAKTLIVASPEVRSYNEGSGPSTPWGRAQVAYKLDKGVVWYSTSGHGGLGVSSKAASKLSPHARAAAMKWAGAFWFEEDILFAIAFYEMPDWYSKYHKLAGGLIQSTDKLKEEIQKYFPRYFEDDFRNEAKNEAPSIKELKVGDILDLEGYKPSVFKIIELGNIIRVESNGNVYRIPKASLSAKMKKLTRDGKVIFEKTKSKYSSVKTASKKEGKEMSRSLIAKEMLSLAKQLIAGPQINKLQDYGKYILYSVEDQGKKVGFLEKWKDTSTTTNPWKAFKVNENGQVGDMIGAFYKADGGKPAAIHALIKSL